MVKELDDLKTRLASGGKDKPALDTVKPMGLLDNPKIRLWTHDLSAEPGATYRYRVRAADSANNVSAYSAVTSATTPAALLP